MAYQLNLWINQNVGKLWCDWGEHGSLGPRRQFGQAVVAAEHTVDFEVENHFHAKLLFRALNVRYDDVRSCSPVHIASSCFL